MGLRNDDDGDCGAGCGHLHAPRGVVLEYDPYIVEVVGSVRVAGDGCWQAEIASGWVAGVVSSEAGEAERCFSGCLLFPA